MENINRVELRGNVGSVRLQTFEDKVMARITLATSLAYKDRTGTPVIETTWHTVVAWEGRGVTCLDRIGTGSKLSVTGRIRSQRYVGSDNNEHTSYDIVAKELKVLPDNEPLSIEM